MASGFIVICIMVLSFMYWCVNDTKGLYAGMAALVALWAYLLLEHLGVPFPANAAGGFLAGVIVLVAYVLVSRRIKEQLAKGGFRTGMIASAAFSFGMILYRPSLAFIMAGGLTLGLGTGYCLCKFYFKFTESAFSGRSGAVKYITLAARFLLGIIILAALYAVTGKMTDNIHHSGNYQLFVFMRFTLLSLWVSAGAPWLFRLLRLAGN